MSEERRHRVCPTLARLARAIVAAGVLGFVLHGAGLALADTAERAPRAPIVRGRPQPPTKPRRTTLHDGHSRVTFHLKLKEGSRVRLRQGSLVSLANDDLSALSVVLKSVPSLRINRLFSRPEAVLAREKATFERASRRKLADKNLYYRVRVPEGTDIARLIDRLNALPIVEIAYPEPLPVPPPVTPDFTGDQDYATAAPRGIDADIATDICGGRGSAVRVTDVEYSWNLDHEDLQNPAPTLFANKTPSDPFTDNNHGTAVLGELAASDNGIGVTGLVHDATIQVVNADNVEDGYDLADSIDLAAAHSNKGDVILIEQQTSGPNPCINGTSGCVAVEWVKAYYDAIVAATAAGINVVEAAGNGNENLDDATVYVNQPFPDGRADSGAIIVGAGSACSAAGARARLDFSTHGTRVNLQGWGECVTTTGYGDKQGGADPNLWYTGTFSGTSSASPIVASAAAALSSVAKTLGGTTLTPAQVRSKLVSTGTPQNTGTGTLTGNIGPLPDLKAALSPYETKPPDVTCPADQVVECTSPAGAAASFTATATDDCDHDPDVSCSPASGSTFALGTTPDTCTAKDAVGNQSQCTFKVTVKDTTPPSITCPAPVTVECTGNNGIDQTDPQLAAFFASVSASDACDPSLSPTHNAPAHFGLGTTPVTFSVTDDSGNTSSCTTSVKVADTQPPVILASVNPSSLWPPNHKLVDIAATVSVKDVCDPSPTFVLDSITSNEPDNGTGDGDVVNDIQGAAYGTPDTSFKLRAERSGNGNGRVYTIVYKAKDGTSNTSTAAPVVEVAHSR